MTTTNAAQLLEPFKDLLKSNGLKITQPRIKVLEMISSKDTAMSQPELEKKLGDQIDRVTLYRCLATFEEKGILHKIFDTNGTAAFALCSPSCNSDHHHDQHVHFICTQCNGIYCLDDIKLPKLSIPDGFQLQETGVNAMGICASCSLATHESAESK